MPASSNFQEAIARPNGAPWGPNVVNKSPALCGRAQWVLTRRLVVIGGLVVDSATRSSASVLGGPDRQTSFSSSWAAERSAMKTANKRQRALAILAAYS